MIYMLNQKGDVTKSREGGRTQNNVIECRKDATWRCTWDVGLDVALHVGLDVGVGREIGFGILNVTLANSTGAFDKFDSPGSRSAQFQLDKSAF